jgi:Na+-translocating ferredoxin:NAD+ oxidoreductase RnfC subunit
VTLVEQIKNAGVIGAGGAGFPTHAKLAAPAEYVIMNAAECEPLLRVDQQLLAIYTDRILQGFAAVAGELGASHAVIGIKGKHRDVIAVLRRRIGDLGLAIEIHELPDFYPAGDEQILVYEVTGRIVPEGGIPIAAGCVVMNVETIFNVSRAMEGKAVTDSFVTVSGAVPRPLTMKVPVGTPVQDVIAQTGRTELTGYAVIDGGPMMGKVLQRTDGAVLKKSKGFIVLPQDHPLIATKTAPDRAALLEGRTACEQCRMCTDLCPRHLIGHHLNPHIIMRAMKYTVGNATDITQAALCSQCGVCTLFACPAHLKPHQINGMIKQQLSCNHIRYMPQTTVYHASPARSYRRIPVKRLMLRIGIAAYDQDAPLTAVTFDTQEYHMVLRQHAGAAAQAVVAVGDTVSRGQLIGAIPEGALGAAVHASVNGTVTAVTDSEIIIRVG